MNAAYTVQNPWTFAGLKQLLACNLRGATAQIKTLYGTFPDRVAGANELVPEDPFFVRFINAAHARGIKTAIPITGTESSQPSKIKQLLLPFLSTALGIQISVDSIRTAIQLKNAGVLAPLSLSAATGIRDPMQLLELVDLGCRITKLEIPAMKNWDLPWLTSMIKMCNALGIATEVTVNAICYTGSNSCTNCNAQAIACLPFFRADPSNWLRLRWILPQHIYLYRKLGIQNFKYLQHGQTMDHMSRNMTYYLTEREYKHNMLNLWRSTKDRKTLQVTTRIPAKLLSEFGVQAHKQCPNDCSVCQLCDFMYTLITCETG